MRTRYGIKIRFSRAPGGYGYQAVPCSGAHRKTYMAALKEWQANPKASAFFQELHNLEETGELTAPMLRDIGNGYDVVRVVDPWVFGNWLGYDMAEVTL